MAQVSLQEGRKLIGGELRYGASISTVIDSQNPIEAKIRYVNEAVINWLEKRGTAAKSLVFIYVVSPPEQPSVLDFTLKLVSQDFKYAPIIKYLEMKAYFLDASGTPYKEFEIHPNTTQDED